MTTARRFIYDGREFPDPGEDLTTEQVRDAMAATFPELTNATHETETKDDVETITFKRAVGTKGHEPPKPEPRYFVFDTQSFEGWNGNEAGMSREVMEKFLKDREGEDDGFVVIHGTVASQTGTLTTLLEGA